MKNSQIAICVHQVAFESKHNHLHLCVSPVTALPLIYSKTSIIGRPLDLKKVGLNSEVVL